MESSEERKARAQKREKERQLEMAAKAKQVEAQRLAAVKEKQAGFLTQRDFFKPVIDILNKRQYDEGIFTKMEISDIVRAKEALETVTDLFNRKIGEMATL